MHNLLPHQVPAVEWLLAHRRGGLFDDQGLGKTIEVAAALEKLHPHRTLIVAPTSVVHNWQHELRKWAPSLARVQVITSGSVSVDSDADVLVLTHGLLLNEKLMRQLDRLELEVVVLDEAHFFRNPRAKRTAVFYSGREAICRRARVAVWVLTGTPIANDPSNLWTMLAGVDPARLRDPLSSRGNLMSYTRFRDRYCEIRPDAYDPDGKVIGIKNAAELRLRMKDFALRRMKKGVLTLPPVRYGTVELTVEKLPPELKQLESNFVIGTELDLRWLRDHESFSTWRRLCGIAKARPAAEVLINDLQSGMDKVVVFAHHTEVLDIMRKEFYEKGKVRTVSITGSISAAQRKKNVDLFQNDPDVRVALCNIVAGGTGVTLTAACDVVFVEMNFVPSDNAQAADRVNRIGQKRPVLVRSFALAGSVDEVTTEILRRKTEMIRAVIG